MDRTEYVAALEREGKLLVGAAAGSNLDTPIPTCPGWDMRTLVRHVGTAHRWATEHVAGPQAEDGDGARGELGPRWPEDARLVEWLRHGHASLVSALAAADPDLECWTFLPAPTPLLFWARRQTHETGIHRVDAENATGPVTPFDSRVALDGIEEMLFGFARRSGRQLSTAESRTLLLEPIDARARWFVRLDPDGIAAQRTRAPEADCTVRGTASALHVLLWNRSSREELDVDGDVRVLDLWRDSVRVRWD
ncbi:MAG: maleylpyruvate isomerase family mycothiol-dependent enzyme [Actinomycetota bacterium]